VENDCISVEAAEKLFDIMLIAVVWQIEIMKDYRSLHLRGL
jgi:hypothetical protein